MRLRPPRTDELRIAEGPEKIGGPSRDSRRAVRRVRLE
jgi:hypothetical protein